MTNDYLFVWFILFWGAAGLLFFVYFGYAFTVWLIAKLYRQWKGEDDIARFTEDYFPDVMLLISLHNEENVLHEKLENTSKLTYSGKFNILFVLDGCTDGSEAIIREYIFQHKKSTWSIFNTKHRVGKERAIRLAIEKIETDILVFSDANSSFSPNLIDVFVRYLTVLGTGAVTGQERRLQKSPEDQKQGEGIYNRYNNWIKEQEDVFSSQTDVNGGIFAIWSKYLPETIPDGATQDGVIPLYLLLRQKKTAYAREAKSIEYYSLSPEEDFKRRIRTISRAFTSILEYSTVLNPLKTSFFGFQVIFHRMLRWFFIPLALLGLISNVCLINSGIIYKFAIGFQLIFYVAALFGYLQEAIGKRLTLLYIPYYFMYIHIAAFIAVVGVIRGKRISLWEPSTK